LRNAQNFSNPYSWPKFTWTETISQLAKQEHVSFQ
jgi:hypothetical protein